MYTQLIKATNDKGMVVKSIMPWGHNQFGEVYEVVIEGATHRITFITNVLDGTNYQRITKVEDLYKNRTYHAQRYFHKYIGLIQGINSATYIARLEESV